MQTHRVGRVRTLALASATALAASLLPATTAAGDDHDGGAWSAATDEVCAGLTGHAPFDDVGTDQTFRLWIECLESYGVIDGFGDGTYGPRETVSREQMAKFIANIVEAMTGDELDDADAGFDDVDADDVFAEFIDKIANADIVQGFEDGSYGPRENVRRDQMATFIANAIEAVTGAELATDGETFDDVDDDNVHAEAIDKLETAGVIDGFGDGTYRPGDDVLRDQMAKFVAEAMGAVLDAGDFPLLDLTDVELSWFHEVSTEVGEDFGDEDLFGVGDAGPAGENGADGSIDLRINAARGCVDFDVEYGEVTGGFAEAPGLHLHVGAPDENGPVTVLFDDGSGLEANAADGQLDGTVCVDDVDVLFDAIEDPENHYVNLHSDDFPPGAIRGQLPGGAPTIADEDVTSEWTVVADPAQVPGGGELGASAVFELTFDSVNDIVCYEITSDGVTGGYDSPAHTATHIHEGDVGEVGPPRVAFRNPGPIGDDERASSGCHRVPMETSTGDPDNGEGFRLAEIEDDPSSFYVDIHTEGHPAGAVRGQLVAPTESFDVELSWFEEVDDTEGEPPLFAVGQPGAAGLAELDVWEDENCVTFAVEYADVDGPFGDAPGLHIHEGDRDENGPVVALLATGADLDAGADDGLVVGTVCEPEILMGDDAGETFDVSDLLTGPEDYYVNLHSDDFPPGAIRGQLPDGPPSIEDGEETSIFTVEAGPDEVPGDDGEEGAEATFRLRLDSGNEVICYEILSDGVSGAYASPAHTATHIHEGDVGEVGPPRVIFDDPRVLDPSDPDGLRASSGCFHVAVSTGTGDDGDNGAGFSLAEIEADPSAFYVDIHTEDHPAGAVRGQLGEPEDDDGSILDPILDPIT